MALLSVSSSSSSHLNLEVFLSLFLFHAIVAVFRCPADDTVAHAMVSSPVGVHVWVLLCAVLLYCWLLLLLLLCALLLFWVSGCGVAVLLCARKTGFAYNLLALLQRAKVLKFRPRGLK